MRGLTTLWIENPLITFHSKNTFDKYITNSFLDNVPKGVLYPKENDIYNLGKQKLCLSWFIFSFAEYTLLMIWRRAASNKHNKQAANAMSEKPPKELFKNVVQGNGKCKHVCLYIHYIRYYIVCSTFMWRSFHGFV